MARVESSHIDSIDIDSIDRDSIVINSIDINSIDRDSIDIDSLHLCTHKHTLKITPLKIHHHCIMLQTLVDVCTSYNQSLQLNKSCLVDRKEGRKKGGRRKKKKEGRKENSFRSLTPRRKREAAPCGRFSHYTILSFLAKFSGF